MTFTVLNRRLHMYVAMFLAPWVLLYGISAVVMNHMPFFQDLYGKSWGQFVKVKETTYDGTWPEGSDQMAVAKIILKDLGMDGAHYVDARRDGSRIIINRIDMIHPKRITFTPTDSKVVVEEQTFQWPLFLLRLHARRGYGQSYLADTLWALSVDLFIVAILVWGLTGLWTWYKMKTVRRWGTVCIAAGCVVFALFLVLI
jgi:hypothetical protein